MEKYVSFADKTPITNGSSQDDRVLSVLEKLIHPPPDDEKTSCFRRWCCFIKRKKV